jgi:hypothetical protein
MDRNGKKQKAKPDPADAHAQRSDTKSQARDTIGRMQADARLQRERGRGTATPAPQGGGKKGHRG